MAEKSVRTGTAPLASARVPRIISTTRMKSLHLFAFLLCCLTSPLHAQSGLTRLGEFRVNTTTTGDQRGASMAMAPNGDFIVVWTNVPDSSVYFRRYNAAGSPIGPERKANTNPVVTSFGVPADNAPTVAIDGSGNFVIVWARANDGSGRGIAFQRFNSSDAPIGINGTPGYAEFPVNSDPTNSQDVPDVAMGADGRFAITWQHDYSGTAGGFSSFVKFYSANGSVLGTEVPLNPTQEYDVSPSITARPGGGFAVAWRKSGGASVGSIKLRLFAADGTPEQGGTTISVVDSSLDVDSPVIAFAPGGGMVIAYFIHSGGDSGGRSVYAQRLNAAGAKIGAPFRVNVQQPGDQDSLSVAFDSDLTFIVAYRSAGFDGPGDGFVSRQFNYTDPSVLTDEFLVNTHVAGNQRPSPKNGSLAADSLGNLVFVWESENQDGDGFGIYADQFFVPDPDPAEFRVNTTRTGDQKSPAVAMNGNGQAVVVWEAPDGNSSGIVAQRYDTDGRRVGAEIPVNTFTTGEQSQPAVVMDTTGKFVVVWKSVGEDGGNDAIYLRRFLADGTADPAAPSPVKVNSTASPSGSGGFLTAPNIATSSTGRIVVTWVGPGFSGYQVFAESGTPDGGEKILNGANVSSCAFTPAGAFALAWTFNPQQNVMESRMHFYNQSGDSTGDEILLSTVGDPTQHPVLRFGSDGKGVAVWRRLNPAPTVGDLEGRLVDANGTLGPILPPLNTSLNGEQSPANIAFQPGGSFLVTYVSESFDGNGTGIALQRFNAAGVKQGSELVVNTERTGDQGGGSYNRLISTDSLGNYIVVWHSPNQDGSGFGVYATKVTVSESPAVTTLAAKDVGAAKATLRATIDPNGQTATLAFEYDDDPAFGSAAVVQVPGSFSGINPLDAEVQVVQGLVKGGTYFFRAKATVGTQVIVGNALDFTTVNAAPVAKEDTFYVTGQDQTLDVLANDTDPDLPGDTLTLSGALPQPSFMAEDGTTVIAGTLQEITLGSRDAFSFTARNTFTDRASFTYNVADADGLTSMAAVQLFRFTALRGIYSGLVTDTSGVEPDGVLKLTVNAVAGRFTGVLFWGGGSYPVDSFFAADGSVTLGVAGTALQFTLRVTEPIEGTIAGTLTDNTVPSQPVTAAISLLREDDGGGDDSTNPTPGNYTTFIDEPQIIDPGAGVTAAAEPRGDTNTSPTGTGFSFAKIGTRKQKRRGRFATSLADGSKFTAGSGLAGRSYTLAQALYKIRQGQFGGSFNSQPTFPSGNNSRFDSSASWTRSAIPGIPGSEFFPGGFRLKLTLAGVPYDGRRANPINFPENGGNNAKVTFRGGGLDEDLSFFVKVDRRNRVDPGSADLVVRMNKIAGTFSGSFVHPGETKRVKFIGLFQQNSAAAPAVEQGLGYFRALELRRTGRVVMKAN